MLCQRQNPNVLGLWFVLKGASCWIPDGEIAPNYSTLQSHLRLQQSWSARIAPIEELLNRKSSTAAAEIFCLVFGAIIHLEIQASRTARLALSHYSRVDSCQLGGPLRTPILVHLPEGVCRGSARAGFLTVFAAVRTRGKARSFRSHSPPYSRILTLFAPIQRFALQKVSFAFCEQVRTLRNPVLEAQLPVSLNFPWFDAFSLCKNLRVWARSEIAHRLCLLMDWFA